MRRIGKTAEQDPEEENTIQLDLDITTYASTIQALIGAQHEKLSEIERMTPAQELKEYAENLKSSASRVPDIAVESLFSRRVTHLVDGIVTVDYTIPMVRKNEFKYYSFISIPREDRKMIILEN